MGCGASNEGGPKVERALLQILEYSAEELDELESTGLTEFKFNKILEEFDVIDTDHSGFIEYPEMKTALQKMWKQFPEFAERGDFSDADIKERIKKYDTNMDGKISRAEYLRYVVLAGQPSKKNRFQSIALMFGRSSDKF